MNMTVFWLLVMIAMLIIEAAVPGLVSIWFALGALLAVFTTMLTDSVIIQVAVFLLMSTATLIMTRPLAKKYINKTITPTNADMIIGKECLVKEQINNLKGTGIISYGGNTWSARSINDDVVISTKEPVIVVKIEGVKAIVRKKTLQ